MTVWQDITERRQVEHDLVESEARYRLDRRGADRPALRRLHPSGRPRRRGRPAGVARRGRDGGCRRGQVPASRRRLRLDRVALDAGRRRDDGRDRRRSGSGARHLQAQAGAGAVPCAHRASPGRHLPHRRVGGLRVRLPALGGDCRLYCGRDDRWPLERGAAPGRPGLCSPTSRLPIVATLTRSESFPFCAPTERSGRS